jgi:hypothetical protein
MAKKKGKSLTTRIAEPIFPRKFTDGQIDKIVRNVTVDDQRKERLCDILNEWANGSPLLLSRQSSCSRAAKSNPTRY